MGVIAEGTSEPGVLFRLPGSSRQAERRPCLQTGSDADRLEPRPESRRPATVVRTPPGALDDQVVVLVSHDARPPSAYESMMFPRTTIPVGAGPTAGS